MIHFHHIHEAVVAADSVPPLWLLYTTPESVLQTPGLTSGVPLKTLLKEFLPRCPLTNWCFFDILQTTALYRADPRVVSFFALMSEAGQNRLDDFLPKSVFSPKFVRSEAFRLSRHLLAIFQQLDDEVRDIVGSAPALRRGSMSPAFTGCTVKEMLTDFAKFADATESPQELLWCFRMTGMQHSEHPPFSL
jgi:hypothetical protein